jgi:hypothetical protein
MGRLVMDTRLIFSALAGFLFGFDLRHSHDCAAYCKSARAHGVPARLTPQQKDRPKAVSLSS